MTHRPIYPCVDFNRCISAKLSHSNIDIPRVAQHLISASIPWCQAKAMAGPGATPPAPQLTYSLRWLVDAPAEAAASALAALPYAAVGHRWSLTSGKQRYDFHLSGLLCTVLYVNSIDPTSGQKHHRRSGQKLTKPSVFPAGGALQQSGHSRPWRTCSCCSTRSKPCPRAEFCSWIRGECSALRRCRLWRQAAAATRAPLLRRGGCCASLPRSAR